MRAKNIDWVGVHYEPSIEPMNPQKRDVTVRFMVSPLDIPEMWRYGIKKTNESRQELVVEFKYLTASESRRSFMKEDVKIEIGKNSKRIYAIVVPLPKFESGQVESEIELIVEMAIDEIQAWEDEGTLRRAHADVIQDMLRQEKSQTKREAIA